MKTSAIFLLRTHEGVTDLEPLEARKVSICRPQVHDPVVAADRRDSRIMDCPASNLRRQSDALELGKISGSFPDQRQCRRTHPGLNRLARLGVRSRWFVDSRMGHDRKELVDAWPRNRPRL